MKLFKFLIISMSLLFSFCSVKHSYKSEFDFANKLAQQSLWKEAHWRWQKVLASGTESAALYNNIAIALEQMGRFEEAEKAYKKAMKLAPHNSSIQGNYKNFKKFIKGEVDKDEKDENEKKKRK